MPAAETYISEMAPARSRGFWSSLIYVSGTSGVLLGTALGAELSAVLTTEQMRDYGWRIPFLLGGVVGLDALYMRRRMIETPSFAALPSIAPTSQASGWR
jgi:MHS family alpha-ketoglutarate permease-like MFS transporter